MSRWFRDGSARVRGRLRLTKGPQPGDCHVRCDLSWPFPRDLIQFVPGVKWHLGSDPGRIARQSQIL